MNTKDKLDYINQHVGVHLDFPKKGIVFRDIFGALSDATSCKYLKEVLLEYIRSEHPDVDVIVGLESRGFLFNMMLATELGIGCAPIRKKGKLPGKCVSVEYTLEYGSDIFEMQTEAIKPGQKVVVVDDLLATGGSLDAAVKLIRKAGGEVVKCLVVMELEFLEGRKKVDAKVHSLLKYQQ